LKIKASKLEAKDLFISKNNYFFLPKNCETKLEESDLEMFLENRYNTLKEFQDHLEKLIVLKWDVERKVTICFCHDGYTKGVCIHKLALDMHQGRLSKLILLQPTGKRGRKRKAAKALEKEINLVLKKSKKM